MISTREQFTREFDAFCRQHGIPADRARLVKRNVELAAQVRALHHALTTQLIGWHEGKHDGEFATCDRCAESRLLLEKLR